MAEEKTNQIDFKVNRSNLYREETFTDLKVGSIKHLIPVKPNGSEDKTRKSIFVGQSNFRFRCSASARTYSSVDVFGM